MLDLIIKNRQCYIDVVLKDVDLGLKDSKLIDEPEGREPLSLVNIEGKSAKK